MSHTIYEGNIHRITYIEGQKYLDFVKKLASECGIHDMLATSVFIGNNKSLRFITVVKGEPIKDGVYKFDELVATRHDNYSSAMQHYYSWGK